MTQASPQARIIDRGSIDRQAGACERHAAIGELGQALQREVRQDEEADRLVQLAEETVTTTGADVLIFAGAPLTARSIVSPLTVR